MIGLPYILPGARYIIMTENDTIETYIFKRSLSSPQGWNDEVSAKGNEVRSEKVSPNQEIIQLKGRYFKISKDVDGLELEIGDLQQGVTKINADISGINIEISNIHGNYANIIQTISEITSEIGDIQGNYSKVTQTINEITSEIVGIKGEYSTIQQTINGINIEVGKKVDAKSIISAINLSTEGIKIEGSRVNITGYVTFDDLATGGSSTISGDNITTGTINANLVKVENIDINSITHNNYLKIITVNAANEFSIGSTAAYGLMPTVTHILGQKIELFTVGGTSINLETGLTTINSARIIMGSGINCEFNNGSLTSNSGSIRFQIGDLDNLTVRNSLSVANGKISVGELKVYNKIDFPSDITFSNIKINDLTSGQIETNDIEIRNGFEHKGSMIGFFGYSPTSKKSVSPLSGSSTVSTVQSKVNEVINAFKSYGLL